MMSRISKFATVSLVCLAVAACSGSKTEEAPPQPEATLAPAVAEPVVIFAPGDIEKVTLTGFSIPNQNGVWSIGEESTISFALPEGAAGVDIRFAPFFPAGVFDESIDITPDFDREFSLSADGEILISEVLTPSILPSKASKLDRRIELPGKAGTDVTLTINIDSIGSPADYVASTDERILGIVISQIETFAE